MKKFVNLVKLGIVVVLVTVINGSSFASVNASDTTKMSKTNAKHAEEKMNMPMHDHSKMGTEKKDKSGTVKTDTKQTIVRTGVINVEAIDKNKDGKVFQDQMDWNVISDQSGVCPICKMTLEEVTIKKAKENLKKNGFKIKE